MQLGGLTGTAALTMEVEKRAELKKRSQNLKQQNQEELEDKSDEE
jgi:hypothetical protein